MPFSKSDQKEYRVHFYYEFKREMIMTIKAEDRCDALCQIDAMIARKDPRICEGWQQWILEPGYRV